jgi:F0F1-type ATP synthase membrane subunit b/b'
MRNRVAKKIEEEAGEKLDKMIAAAAVNLEREIRVQLTKLMDRAGAESREMTQFVANQEEAIVKESQLMVANIVAKAEKEAEVYRQNQIDKVSSQINSIVSSAAKDVLGRSISISEHEDLVSQALERAKKDKFFI